MPTTTKETITLYFREGSSDKFYTISLEEDATGMYSVPFVFGRRGTTGQAGEKCSGVAYPKAKKAYDQVVNEKKGKGYTEGAGMKPYAGTPKAKEATGIHCQLLTEVPEKDMKYLINDPGLVAQEKMNGKRMIIAYVGGKAKAINRKGLECGFPSEVEKDIKEIAKVLDVPSFVIDGECVGVVYHVFDVLEWNGKDYRDDFCIVRLNLISALMGTVACKNVLLVPTAQTATEKQALYDITRRANGEGVVFKAKGAKYKAGITEEWKKVKFWDSASCIVTGINAKRSVALGLLSGADIIAVGNCTIPASHEIPKVDDIVEVRYLYGHRNGSLYQPQYEGVRDDLSIDDCKLTQVKYKPDDTEVEMDEV